MHDNNSAEPGSTPDQINSVGLRTFQVTGLESDRSAIPTGMRDEIIILSWLIVLLRTQESDQVVFDWSYKDRTDDVEQKFVNGPLSMNDVMTGTQNTVSQVAAAIFSHAGQVSVDPPTTTSDTLALVLSTTSTSQDCGEKKGEPTLRLEAYLQDGCLNIDPLWHSASMLPYTIAMHIETFADTVQMCLANPDMSIEQCLRPTVSDLDAIWELNHQLPPSYNFCMHDMVSERAQVHPDRVAISSWDGDLTYAQIEQYSTFVAYSLKAMGVELHDVLPVCFEKSRWTIVAVLAVMKVGATLALMDPTLPLARLQNMAEQVGAKSIVTSRSQCELSASIMPNGQSFVVEEDAFKHLTETNAIPQLSAVPSSALMYIIFTSGSTGTPKGVTISHETYTSSAIPRAKAVGYTKDSRVLDFASYAFDVSIDSMLLTLGNGGCLCIPSDEDRLNDINEVIRKMQINYAGITPSVARILDHDVIASLNGLGLGGEAASAGDVTRWGQDTRIIIGYGPCECTIGCTVNSSAATGRDYVSIGPGNGAAIWIVDPNDHETLMPIGAIGELLVEGPIVGQGYLNDPEKTAAAFIKDPSWLTSGHKSHSGRSGRLYKTGDLGKYDPDGSGGIVFAGRKDTQVKLRGQRVELGEIESQLKARLPSDMTVIAEVIVPQASGGGPTLVAFIALPSVKGLEHTDIQTVQLSDDVSSALSAADADLAKVLPRYMVPTAYIPVNIIPVLISGKTDRKRLRQFGITVDMRRLEQEKTSAATRELTDLETRLRQAWSQILKLDQENIRLEDNFFALGGDSLAAMKLVSACRAQGLDLSVISTFAHPTLIAMADVVQSYDSKATVEMSPFSMISQDIDGARSEAAQACTSDPAAIEDIYPCTPTQESLFTFSIKSTIAYVAQRVACIPPQYSVDTWKQAWEDVVAANPILRTRLAQLQDEAGLLQVIIKDNITWRHSTDLKQYLEDDRNLKMELGQNLARYAIVEDVADGKRYMIWTVHHVLYDGWSEPLILKEVSNALERQHKTAQTQTQTQTQTQMRDFVKFVHTTDQAAMGEFWRRELKGADGPQFPRLPSRDYMPNPDAMLERQIPLQTSAGSPFTMATVIRAAWALVASQYSGSDDVVFGETLTGRDISLPGVENIVGPLIATVPVQIHIKRTCSVESYLQTVQQGVLTRTPWQHMGMQYIRKVSRDAQYACEAGTGLVIQPVSEYAGSELGFELGDVVREALHFNPYPLMLACGIRKGGFKICASFDSSLIEVKHMKRIFAQMETACLQLTKDLSRSVAEITCLPAEDLSQIWLWNKEHPLSLDKSSKTLQANGSIKQGATYPRAVVPWVCDPRNASLLTPIGCIGELWLEGAILPSETTRSPAWLLAGSSDCDGRTGNIQSTGDLVQLQEDGSLTFIRRKDNTLPVQGHAVDVTELEDHISRLLPSTARAAVGAFEAKADTDQPSSRQGLVIFIEEQALGEEKVELMSAEHEVNIDQTESQDCNITICAAISVDLAVALKKLDKFIRDSLPSYLAPSAYIVMDRLPKAKGLVDHNSLSQLASNIPQDVINELNHGFETIWSANLAQTKLTDSETILRAAWAKILGMSEAKIDVDDNFFRLGGDSVLAMKLVSSLRAQRHGLTVANIFQNMRLGDAAKVLKVHQVSQEKKAAYKPFSTLGDLNVESFLSDVVQPQLADSGWSVSDVLPVTDSQALDIRGTVQAPRTSIQYTMLYVDQDIDRTRLFRACNDLLKTHDILRTVFIERDSSLFQVVLKELDNPMILQQTDGDLEQCVTDLCNTDIESDFCLGSSYYKALFVEGDAGKGCLVLALSHALYDGISLPLLLRDLETLYKGGSIVDVISFPQYISRIRDEQVQAPARKYWQGLLADSPFSVLEGTTAQPTDKAVFRETTVDISDRPIEITTANLLTAAWAIVLARRLQAQDVTFGGITSGRTLDMANAENVQGPCYQFTPIRVRFQPHWTYLDLLRFVQRQAAESAAHDFLGFEQIATHCTSWDKETRPRFFDSLVHHQDLEDFDTMPFAGTAARVEISNPHGDSPDPFKAVSFLREGKLHVGVVGSVRDEVFVDSVLDELASVVGEVVAGGEGEVVV